MARENSFSDSDGRSLTPDLDEENDFDAAPSPISPSNVSPDKKLQNSRSSGNAGSGEGSGEANMNSLEASTTPTLAPSPSYPVRPITDLTFAATNSAPGALPTREDTIRSIDTAGPTRSLTSDSALNAPKRPGAALDRFRASARKVMQMKRTSGALTSLIGGVGGEPGIDPRRSYAFLTYGHINEKCTIEMADYSAVRSSFGRMSNKGFAEFLRSPIASEREPWVKVRWINIGGISWDVLSAVALKYGELNRYLQTVWSRK